jgi:RNA-directed DNA polymerase
VRNNSINKLKESIVSIFTSHKYAGNKSVGFLTWRLNLRITGCIFQRKCKGWLFFFLEINDESLLHELDHYVQKIIKKFQVKKISYKKLVRAFYEAKFHKYETKYIPNFDNYTIEQKREVLNYNFDKDVEKWSDRKVEYEFIKRLTKETRDLLTDIQSLS